MAIIRCEDHPVQVKRAKNTYVRRVEPVGYPDTAAICGRNDCENPGYVWLTREEYQRFKKGIRYFELDTALITVKVGDEELPLPDSYLNELKTL